MQQVKPSFNIQAEEIDFERAQLFVEAGPMALSFTVMGSDNCFRAVIIYPFSAGLNDNEIAEKLKEICNSENLLEKQFSKTHLFWAFAESILVPAELMNSDRNLNMLNLVFGDSKPGIIHSDFLYRHNLHNVYRIPEQVIDIFSNCLPVATQTHVFSAMVNKDIPSGNHLFTVFYSNSLTIMLCKEGKLQVVQNFNYTHADDCVFHLLNVCKGFDVQPESVVLHINGMIDVNSGLYAAVYRYFLQIEFDKLPEGCTYYEKINDHPPHFFSHLFEMASCV